MTDIPYACCSRCGKALPKAILHPFKGRRPSVGLFCPSCAKALVKELEKSLRAPWAVCMRKSSNTEAKATSMRCFTAQWGAAAPLLNL